MIRRRALLAAAALPAPALAQQGRVWRIGIISPGQLSIDDFRRSALPVIAREGFVEGRNLEVHARNAAGEPAQLPVLAAELAALGPDVVVAVSNPAALAMRAASPGVPIVLNFAGTDPVADGLAQSLSRPGGSTTGIVMLAEELDVKRMELAREAFPAAARIGFLAGATATDRRVAALEAMARRLGVQPVMVRAGAPASFPAAFDALRDGGAEALVISSFPGFSSNAAELAERALAARLPTVCEWRFMAEAGCMISLGPVMEEIRRRVAVFVIRILRGEAPGGIPMERADRFELVVNLRTARSLGVELPELVLARADEVIE